MSTLTWLVAGGVFIYTTCLTPSEPFKKLEVDITVQDEQGNPVENVEVKTAYLHWTARSWIAPLLFPFNKGKNSPYKLLSRHTNENGICKMRFHTWEPDEQIHFFKEGWYKSVIKLQDRMPETPKKWTKEPQKVTARLRKIKNPIQLLMDDIAKPRIYPVTLDTPIGYDMVLR